MEYAIAIGASNEGLRARAFGEVHHTVKIATFFWEGERLMSEEKFTRVQRIHSALASEFCNDRGLVMEMVLTGLADDELAIIEKVTRLCRDIHEGEENEEMTKEDRVMEIFHDAAS